MVVDLDLADRIQAETFVRRAYEPELCRWISERLRPGGLFVDVGANVGLVSFTVGQSGARVIAFEPDARNCEQWQINRELNPQVDARLIRKAVGDHQGIVRFATGTESGWGRVHERGIVTVRQTTLDQELQDERIDVLKIDVEGYEPRVLRGAERLLSSGRVEALVCEIEGFAGSQGIATHLAQLGYRREAITPVDSAFVR